MQTLTIASQNAVGARDIGVATSSSTFFRQIGGTLGVAVIFSLLFSRLPDTLKAAFADPKLKAALAKATDPNTAHGQAILSDPHNAHILSLLKNPALLGNALSDDTAFLKTSSPALTAPFLNGFANATASVFLVEPRGDRGRVRAELLPEGDSAAAEVGHPGGGGRGRGDPRDPGGKHAQFGSRTRPRYGPNQGRRGRG